MFLPKNKYLPERKKSSCKKLYQLHVRNATILKNFTATAKISLVIKNINAANVSTNSLQILLMQGLANPPVENIRPALDAIKLPSFITTTIFTLIIVVVTRSVTTHCLYQNQLLYQPLQCLNCLVKLILSVCVILPTLF